MRRIALAVPPSKLVIADRLISLAKDADRGGFPTTADQLVRLAWTVLDEMPIQASNHWEKYTPVG
jgi:hypothetical protein